MNKIIARLNDQEAGSLTGSEIAEVLEDRLRETNCAEFMTPELLMNLIGLLTTELYARSRVKEHLEDALNKWKAALK